MEILIVLGSIRPERKSHRLAYYLNAQLIAKGVTVRLIDLRNYPLPLFGSAISAEEKGRVDEISAGIKNAQAVIIVTPEYHSNIPAALKNVLEYCGLNLIGKVTGIASASVTKFGGLHASNNLQITLLNLGAYPVSKRLLVPEIHFAFNPDNEPVQQEMKEQAERFLQELLSHAALLKNGNAASGHLH